MHSARQVNSQLTIGLAPCFCPGRATRAQEWKVISEKQRAGRVDATRRWRARNHEELLRRRRAEYAANPERHRLRSKLWGQQNPELYLGMTRKWRQENPSKIKIYRKKYLPRQRIVKKNRRAREKGAEGFFTLEDIGRITSAQKGRCAYCRRRRVLSVDHIIPLSRGGSNWPRNIQMACRPCNAGKKDKLPEDYARFKGRLL